ncbi:MAG: hypothetical protein Q9170_005462 [Blastenia crenularia]
MEDQDVNNFSSSPHASYVLNGHRLRNSLALSLEAEEDPVVTSRNCLDNFHHFTASTLPHLVALLVHSSTCFPPTNTSLLVIDGIASLFSQAFSQPSGYDPRTPAKKNDAGQWAAGRRWAVMADLISAIAKLAATRTMAVILTSQTTTKVTLDNAALLQPAMLGAAWDTGINCRILLFRDWQAESGGTPGQYTSDMDSDLRYAAVVKLAGNPVDGLGEIVPFTVEKHGLREANVSSAIANLPEATAPLSSRLKRKRNEIADSASESGDLISDDEFDWVED